MADLPRQHRPMFKRPCLRSLQPNLVVLSLPRPRQLFYLRPLQRTSAVLSLRRSRQLHKTQSPQRTSADLSQPLPQATHQHHQHLSRLRLVVGNTPHRDARRLNRCRLLRYLSFSQSDATPSAQRRLVASSRKEYRVSHSAFLMMTLKYYCWSDAYSHTARQLSSSVIAKRPRRSRLR